MQSAKDIKNGRSAYYFLSDRAFNYYWIDVVRKAVTTNMAKIEEIKRRYKDEWVLVEVIEEDELGQPTEVELIAHSKSRDDTYEAMRKTKATDIAHFYTGAIPKKGYAVAF